MVSSSYANKSILTLLCVCFSAITMADEYAEDPDIDYLPPETFVSSMRMVFKNVFSYVPQSHPPTYREAKSRLYRTVRDEHTLYCGCPTNLSSRTFDSSSCGYVAAVNNTRARRIEAEHILPASLIARFKEGESCWVKQEACGSARECCIANDEQFRAAHNDLVNLYPSIGELNAARSNYSYSLLDGERRVYGDCDFEVDRDRDEVEPRDDVRGDIARVYFYMRDTYGLVYPEELEQRLVQWNELDPVSEVERIRNRRVYEAQGSSNFHVAATE